MFNQCKFTNMKESMYTINSNECDLFLDMFSHKPWAGNELRKKENEI